MSSEASDVTDRPRLSACIIAFNEADRIGDCIRSLDFCDEILVVDSRSTDETCEISAEFGARVIERNWPGHVKQKEFTIRQAEHDWVLCVDADERISAGLKKEILALRDAGFPGKKGWRMPRCSNYLGQWIRHGTWYPDRQLRLFDRRVSHWGGHDPHDLAHVDGPTGNLSGDLLHYPYRSLEEHIANMNNYTTIMAQGMNARGRKGSVWRIILSPAWRFFRFYVLKRGFLEGWRGLVMAYLAAHYVRLKYTKLYVLQNKKSSDPTLSDATGKNIES